MAVVPKPTITALEELLNKFGNPLAGHAEGEVTGVLLGGINSGLGKMANSITTFFPDSPIKNIDPAKLNTEAGRTALQQGVNDLVKDWRFKLVDSALKNGATPEALNSLLETFGFKNVSIKKEEIDGLLFLHAHLNDYMKYFGEIEAATTSIAPAAAAPAAGVDSELTRINTAIATASAGLTEEIKALETMATELGAQGITVDGQWEDLTRNALPGLVLIYRQSFGMDASKGLSPYYTPDLMAAAQAIPANHENYPIAQHFIEVFKPLADAGFLDLANQELDYWHKKDPEKLNITFGPTEEELQQVAEYHQATADAVNRLKLDLVSLAGVVNTLSKSEFVPEGFTLVSPGQPDGKFDPDAQNALQQIIGVLRNRNALGIRPLAGEFDPLVYTPQLGVQILVDIYRPENADLLAAFDNIQPFKDPMGDENAEVLTGPRAFIARLNFLVDREAPMPQIAHPKNAVAELTQIQNSTIERIVDTVDNTSLPLFEVMVRDFTGNVGLSDLRPDLVDPYEMNNALGGLPADRKERMAQLYKNAFKAADTPEKQAALSGDLVTLLSAVNVLPYGGASRRFHYPEMLSNSVSDALQQMRERGLPLDSDDAANLFAQLYVQNLTGLEQNHGGPAIQQDPGYIHAKGQVEEDRISFDPFVRDRLLAIGFDPDGNGVSNADEVGRNLDQVFATYDQLYMGSGGYDDTPLMFRDANGQVFIAGVERGSNLFSVYPLDVEKMQQIIAATPDRADLYKKLCEEIPGYKFAMNNYHRYFDNFMMEGGAKYEETVLYAANMTQRHLDEQARVVGAGYKNAVLASASSAAELTSREYLGLQRQLQYTIDNPNLPGKDLARELLTYDENPAAAYAALSAKPKLFASQTGVNFRGLGQEYFLFSKRDRSTYNGDEEYFATNVTDEIKLYHKMLKDGTLDELIVNDNFGTGDTLATVFPNLTAVAMQYAGQPPAGYTDALDLIHEIVGDAPAPALNPTRTFGAAAAPASSSASGPSTSTPGAGNQNNPAGKPAGTVNPNDPALASISAPNPDDPTLEPISAPNPVALFQSNAASFGSEDSAETNVTKPISAPSPAPIG